MALLELNNLSKAYNGQTVLDGINLQVEQGEIVVILGPSGSGKSTLLRCINYLETPDSGSITLAGQTVEAQRASKHKILGLRRKAAFVFQNYALFRNKTALGNVTEALIAVQGMAKPEAEARAMAILKDVGLAERREAWPSQLSGGQQQRIGIARAMALNAELMLLDEPTSALDPEKVHEVLDLMKQLARQKHTMVVVTHEIAFAREVADRVVFIDEGKIVEMGSPQQVIDNPEDKRTRAFLRQVPGR